MSDKNEEDFQYSRPAALYTKDTQEKRLVCVDFKCNDGDSEIMHFEGPIDYTFLPIGGSRHPNGMLYYDDSLLPAGSEHKSVHALYNRKLDDPEDLARVRFSQGPGGEAWAKFKSFENIPGYDVLDGSGGQGEIYRTSEPE